MTYENHQKEKTLKSNKTTLKALKEFDEMKANSKKYKRRDSIEDLMKE